MELVMVDGGSWWVPASDPYTLAVQIKTEDEYMPAIRGKLYDLIEAFGPYPEALAMVTWLMDMQGVRIHAVDDPDDLIAQVLATSSIGEMVRAGAPWMSDPEPRDCAAEWVEAQAELTLGEFLG